VDNIYKDLSQIAASKELFECCIHKRIETSQLIIIAVA
jgi:hypothetical protein